MNGFNPKKIKWSFGFYTTTTPAFFIKTKDAKIFMHEKEKKVNIRSIN